MKKITLLLAVLALTACGPAEVLNSGCGGDLRGLCDAVFGEIDKQGELEERIESLEQRLSALENDLTNKALELTQLIAKLEAELNLTINEITSNVSSLTASQQAQLASIQTLELEVTSLATRLAVLEGYNQIVEIINPCAATSGFNEVLLRTSNGELLAYFEQGSKRFITTLSDGNYQTTDSRKCNFSISNGQII